ncbi:MAG: hypothetical protein KDD02_09180 [Phaeodactylibacter sp.]|nr:hypothetical protein [Phaeodactylibacter sp.]MCB9302387.1 hypothetical protein [Lewinellaceae bacterium]
MPLHLPFGLRDGRLLSIEEAARGLACGCICPACQEPLVAKKGARHAHHFAHHRGSSCAYGLETALHLKAKEILEQARRITLPPVFLHRQQQPLFRAQLIRFDKVRVEQYLDGIVPDLVLEAGPKRLLLEIAATHPAPEKKRRRLQQLGWPALEIDILPLARDLLHDFSRGFTSFSDGLIHGLAHKRWLFHPKKQGIEYRLRKEAAARPVRHRYFKGYHGYLVPDCPLNKRRWRSGFREGKSYALLWQDCLYCPQCLEINFHNETVGYRLSPQEPKTVCCWGHLPLPRAPEWVSTV